MRRGAALALLGLMGCSGGSEATTPPVTEAPPATLTSTTPPPSSAPPATCAPDAARDARIAEVSATLESRLEARGASPELVAFHEAVLAWHAADPCTHRRASLVEERDAPDPAFEMPAIGTSDTGPLSQSITHYAPWNDERSAVVRHVVDAWNAALGDLVVLAEASPDRAPLPRVVLHQRIRPDGTWEIPGRSTVVGIALESTLDLTAPGTEATDVTAHLPLDVPLPRGYEHMEITWTGRPGELPGSDALYAPALRAILERASLRTPMLLGLVETPPSIAALLAFHGRYRVDASIDPAPCAGDALVFPSTTATLDAFDGELVLANVPRIYVVSPAAGGITAEAIANDDTTCPDQPRAHERFTLHREGAQLRGEHASTWHLEPHCAAACAIGGPLVLTEL